MGSSPKVIQHAIVTYARSWSALAATRSLGKRGVKVYTGDVVSKGAATFSKYSFKSFVYPDPGDEKKFISFLVKKCREIREKHGGEILLLPIHEETYLIAKNYHRFPKYVNFVTSPYNLLNKIQNKEKLVDIARKAKVKIPKTWKFKNKKEAVKQKRSFSFPLFIKLPEGSGSTTIFRVESEKEFEEKLAEVDESFIIQEFIPGDDYCCCVLMDEGRKVALLNYTAIQTYPIRSGTTVYRKNVKMPRIEREALKLLKKIGWHGVAELDFRVNSKTGEVFLIEVNPRFWGGLNQAISSNLDFPYLVWRMAEGHMIDSVENMDENVRTRNFAGHLAATLQEMFEDSPGRSFMSSISYYRRHLVEKMFSKNAVDDIYSKDDLKPLAGILFPLSLYKKYGFINSRLLIASSPDEEVRRLRDKYKNGKK